MIQEEERKIIERLKTCIGYDAPIITQEQFDNMIEYIMKYENSDINPKELIWRLCGCYEDLNFNKAIDIFVDSKDAYYTSELVSFVDNIDENYLIEKMIATNDIKYINDAIGMCGKAMTYYLKKENVELIRNFCDKNSK